MTSLSSAAQARIATELGKRAPTLTIEELLAAVTVFDGSSNRGASLGTELGKRLQTAKLTEVLGVASANVPPSVKQAAQQAAERAFPLRELRDEMPAVAKFLRAADPQVVQLARAQIARGVQRAPMPTWLYWLGQGNDDLNALIWDQINSRLQSGDPQLWASYVEAQLGVLGNPDASLASRRSALELLRRLKPKEVVGRIIGLWPLLPPELRPVASQLLKDAGREKTADLIALAEQRQQPGDRVEKNRLEERMRRVAVSMTTEELLDAARIRDLAIVVRERIGTELGKRLPEAKLSELLGVMTANVPPAVKQAAAQAAAERTFTSDELRDQMPAVAQFVKAADPQVAEFARTRLVQGVQAATIPDYLFWLGQGSHELNEMIAEQIDRRLQSADAQQRTSCVAAGLSVLGDQNASLPCRQYALGLLRRLRPQEAVGPVIDLLPQPPPGLQPMTGELLEELTGQDYGPKPGDGAAEVDAATAKWRAWWANQRGK
jgi:sirohydrochlorin ferrochelatase